MEALLHGIPQFVVAAISMLITSGQVTNIARIENLFARQIVRPTTRAKLQWNLMMTGFWAFQATALVTFARIFAGGLVDDSQTHTAFINLDLGIVALAGVGSLGLTSSGFLAWRVPWLWGPWQRQRGSEERS